MRLRNYLQLLLIVCCITATLVKSSKASTSVHSTLVVKMVKCEAKSYGVTTPAEDFKNELLMRY